MTGDQRGARGSGDGLLYVPDDDLVRSTVDGPDGDWADARSYVPSDALISQVLRESRRETARFRFPDWYLSPESRTARGPLRAASALFAALQVSPSMLAAATAVHVAAFLILSPVNVGGGRAPETRRAPMVLVQVPRLVYFVPRATESAPPVSRRPTVAVTRGGFRLKNPDSAAARSTATRAETLAVVDTGVSVGTGAGAEDREIVAALDQEFQLGGDPLRVEQSDRGRLIELARVLTVRPRVRLHVVGIGPPRRDAAMGPREGAREAEALARELMALGIPREQIELDAAVSEQRCPEREPSCAAGRSRVKTSIAPSRR
jgi:hypothetical protein